MGFGVWGLGSGVWGFWIGGLGSRVWGLVFNAHRLVYHSTLGLRVIKKKKDSTPEDRKWSIVFEAHRLSYHSA